jgi:hypothetical protein
MAWLKRHLSSYISVISPVSVQQLFLSGFQTLPVADFTPVVAEGRPASYIRLQRLY